MARTARSHANQRRALLVLLGLAALIVSVGQAQTPTSGGGTETSPCLTDATIEVTATPPTITYPQSSVVHWSVGLPSGCSAVQVRFDGEAVGKSGSQTVTPPVTTAYTVGISDTHGQTSVSVLNTIPEKLPALELRDIDGDGVCDVVARPTPGVKPKYSKSGTSPWISPLIGQ